MSERTLNPNDDARLPTFDELQLLRTLTTTPPVTTKALTLYVSESGSDATGDGSLLKPFRQIQAALAAVPKQVEHNVTISIGAGTFNGFGLIGYHVGASTVGDCSFTIQGTLGAPTLTTGSASGVADSGDTVSMTDAAQNWTVDELKGAMLKVGSNYRPILSNTSDTIQMSSAFPSNIGTSAYEIVEPKTILNTRPSAFLLGLGVITVTSCIAGYARRLTMENFDIQAQASSSGFVAYNTQSFVLRRSRITRVGAATKGVLVQGVSGEYHLEDLHIGGAFSFASVNLLWNQGPCRYLRCGCVDSAAYGIVAQRTPSVQGVDVSVVDAGTQGIIVKGCEEFYLDRGYLVDNGTNGLQIQHSGVVEIKKLSGTGNVGHGVYVENNSFVDLKEFTNLSITGTLGELTLDEGNTTLVWATSFPSDGSYVVNATTLSNVKRTD